MAQQSRHSREHERYSENLKTQGYDVEKRLFVTGLIAYEFLEPLLDPRPNLATTAGLHYTALLAEIGLESGILTQAQPNRRYLFEWHAAEEIEHKAVAYELLNEVADSYFLRIVGLVIATLILFWFSTFCTASLLYTDKKLFERRG